MSIGFNVHNGVKDEPRLVEFYRKTKPRWGLFMNNMSLAQRVKDASPTTNIIYRDYQPDGAWINHSNPQDYIDYTQRLLAGHDFYGYVDNEVGLNPKWYSALIDKNRATANLNLVIGNISVGTPEFAEWKNPDVKALVQKIADNRNHIVLGMHEYGHILMTSGLQDNNWIFPVADWPREILRSKNNYHIGRFKALVDEYPNLPIRIVMTEHGWDDLPDMKTRQSPYGVFPSSYGWTNCVQAWRKIYGSGLDIGQFMALQVGYADKIIYPYGGNRVEGQLLYCYGTNDNRWKPFDLEPNVDFMTYLEALNTEVPATPTPTIPPVGNDDTQPIPVITDLQKFKNDLKFYIDNWHK